MITLIRSLLSLQIILKGGAGYDGGITVPRSAPLPQVAYTGDVPRRAGRSYGRT